MNIPAASRESFEKLSRNMTTTYELGTNEAGEKVQVEISSSHNKERKAYSTTVIRSTVKNERGFAIRSFDLFGDSCHVNSESTSRYSANSLMAFHWESIKVIEGLLERETHDKLTRLFQPVRELATV